MSASEREELLTELRRITAEALGNARAGRASAEDLTQAIEAREALFSRLAQTEGVVTSRMRALAHEISMLDRTLMAWCEHKQRGVARNFVKRPRRAINYGSHQPRIISQEA